MANTHTHKDAQVISTEMRIKTTMRYHVTSSRMGKMKKTVTSADKDMEPNKIVVSWQL